MGKIIEERLFKAIGKHKKVYVWYVMTAIWRKVLCMRLYYVHMVKNWHFIGRSFYNIFVFKFYFKYNFVFQIPNQYFLSGYWFWIFLLRAPASLHLYPEQVCKKIFECMVYCVSMSTSFLYHGCCIKVWGKITLNDNFTSKTYWIK